MSGDSGVERSPYVTVHRSESSAPFFDATAHGELLIRECSSCGHLRAARRGTCRQCGHESFEYRPAEGTGTVISWAINPGSTKREPSTPMVFGLVELSEGPWLESLLIGIAPEDMWVGLPVAVRFVRGVEGESFPAFGPDAAGDDRQAGDRR
ncbi:Zn-ribbon domain-containing OB-fold protein [Gordonia sp. DT30]|uniref:Zn-ribbon domain-containing OB-fold protein n=1 Tax=Gordonia sp. DT30 TaxID=3416546 RepID=UPI003CF61672